MIWKCGFYTQCRFNGENQIKFGEMCCKRCIQKMFIIIEFHFYSSAAAFSGAFSLLLFCSHLIEYLPKKTHTHENWNYSTSYLSHKKRRRITVGSIKLILFYFICAAYASSWIFPNGFSLYKYFGILLLLLFHSPLSFRLQ